MSFVCSKTFKEFCMGVKACGSGRCKLCSMLIEGDKYKFNCNFIFYVKKANFTCKSENIIYVIRCSTCHAEYIGETVNFRNRMNKHKQDIRGKKERGKCIRTCRAADHLEKCGSELDVEKRFEIFILEEEIDQAVRKAKEAYYIRLFSPPMNK